MDRHAATTALAVSHQLTADQTRQLRELAGLASEPEQLRTLAPKVLALLAAALGGFGLLLWIAANWGDLPTTARFALLEALLLVSMVGAWGMPNARKALGLMAFICIGGLLALIGMTYQTGADPWQLFAAWAFLSLPLALALRSDMVWTPWALVITAFMALWLQAHTQHTWRMEEQDFQLGLLVWLGSFLVLVWLSPQLRRITGAGSWSLRWVALQMAINITALALAALSSWHGSALAYGLALLLLLGLAAYLASPFAFDMFGLCAAALGFNVLVVFGIGNLMLSSWQHRDWFTALLVIGLSAAGLLTGSVKLILMAARRAKESA